MATSLVHQGLRRSTHKTYLSAQRYYQKFCLQHQLPFLPASEQTLLRFIAYCHSRKMAPSSIQVYLSAISALHQLNSHPVSQFSSYRIKLALKAVSDIGPSKQQKAPITYQLLSFIMTTLDKGFAGLLYKAVLTLAFYGALRGSAWMLKWA